VSELEQVEQVEQVQEIESVEIWLNTQNFHAALAAVNPAREDLNSYRPILECFNVEIVADTVTVTTTNSYLALRSTYRECLFSTDGQAAEKHSFMFGAGMKLTDLKSVLTEKTVRVEITNKTVSFSTINRNHVVVLDLTEGTYPNMENFYTEADKRVKSKDFSTFAFNSAIFSKLLAGQKAFLKIAKEKPEACPIRVLTTDSLKPALIQYTVPDFGEILCILMPVRVL
jgi:hypothetical protein